MLQDATPVKVLDSVTTGTSAEFGLGGCDEIGLLIDWGTGCTSGAFVIESAPYGGYTGTWAEQLRITFSGTAPLVQTDSVQINGVVGRVRVATSVGGGGTASAYITRKSVGVY